MRDEHENELELFEALPFMESFPFDEYEVIMETEGTDVSGISEILTDALGTFGISEKINFYYNEDSIKLLVSFSLDNIYDISDNSSNVVQLSPVRKYLDSALTTADVEEKLIAVRKSNKFIAKLKIDPLYVPPFESILYDMLIFTEVTLSTMQILGIMQLNYDKIFSLGISEKETKVLIYFLNFRLHYARIILGIVIATKIH